LISCTPNRSDRHTFSISRSDRFQSKQK
jgi:hypothetical protein